MKHFDQMGGRASRRQFWSFTLVFLAVYVACALIDSWLGSYLTIRLELANGEPFPLDIGLLALACALLHAIPHWSNCCRRMHDVGVSAWWLILGIFPFIGILILIVFFIWPGDSVENTYGPRPA